LFGFLALLGAGGMGLLHELGVRQPSAYLSPLGNGAHRYAYALLGVGLCCGVLVGQRVHVARARTASLPLMLFAGAVLAASAAPLSALAFAHGGAVVTGLAAAAAAGLCVGTSFRVVHRELREACRDADVLEYALSPGRLFIVTLTLAGATLLSARIGMARSGLLLAVLFTLCSLAWVALARWLDGRMPASSRVTHGGALAIALGVAAVGFHVESVFPLAAVRRHAGELLYTSRSPHALWVITSAQQSFAVFREDHLEVSMTDHHRYFEALTHPALSGVKRRASVLLLGGGKGFVEREILRYSDVRSLVVVSEDRTPAGWAQNMPWWRAATADALRDPRVELVEAELLPWLMNEPRRFDVVIADLSDPDGPFEAKNFTRFAFQEMARHLTPHGVIALQGTSPFRSPQAFATIVNTLRAAGLRVRPYHASLPTLGEWGFALAARDHDPAPGAPPPGLRYFDAQALTEAFVTPPDSHRASQAVNRLDDQLLLDQLGMDP
jgi:spermidine synthase